MKRSIAAWTARAGQRLSSISSASMICFHQPDLVVLIKDREIRLQTDQFCVPAQHPRGNRVERSDPEPFRGTTDHRRHTVAHFTRRLVGERHGQDLVRPGTARHQDMADPGREDACFTGAGPGQHQKRTVNRFDGLALGVVQTLKVGCRRHCRGID